MAANSPAGPFGFIMPQMNINNGSFMPFYIMDPSAANTAGATTPQPPIPGGQMVMMMPMMPNNMQPQQQPGVNGDQPMPTFFYAPVCAPQQQQQQQPSAAPPPPLFPMERKPKATGAFAREDDESSMTSCSSVSSHRRRKRPKRRLSRSQVLELFTEFIQRINPDVSDSDGSETDRESNFDCIVGVKKGKLKVLKNFTPSSPSVASEVENEVEVSRSYPEYPEPRLRNSASVPKIIKGAEGQEERCPSVPTILMGPPPDASAFVTVELNEDPVSTEDPPGIEDLLSTEDPLRIEDPLGTEELIETSARSMSRISAMLENFGQGEIPPECIEEEIVADFFEPAAFSTINYNEEIIGDDDDDSSDPLEDGLNESVAVEEEELEVEQEDSAKECSDVEVDEDKDERKPQKITITVTKRARRHHIRLTREDEQSMDSAEPAPGAQPDKPRSCSRTLTFTALKFPDSDTPYQCCECGKSFKQLRYFKCHAVSLHNGQDCVLCGANILGRFRYRRHMAKVHGIDEIPGTDEKESNAQLRQIEAEIRDNVRPEVLQQQQQPPAARKEKKKKRGKNASVDGDGAQAFASSFLDILGPVNVFSCNSCPEIFPTAAKLKWHIEERHGRTKLPCRICSVAFCHLALLNRHYTTVHPDSEFAKALGGTECKICGKMVRNMTLHRALHSSTKPWKCNVCGRGFKHKCNLQAHTFTHKKAEDRPFICNICGAGFLRLPVLNDHKAAHRVPGRGIQPKVVPRHLLRPRHMCSICDRGFFLKRNLSRHLIHHAAPPEKKHFPCLRCERVFTNVEYLKTHMSVHSDVRPYRCTECSRSFRWRANLKSHMQRTHRPVQPAAEH